MIFFRNRRQNRRLDLELECALRAKAFAAGYRCAQNYLLPQFGTVCTPLDNWEKEEANNAIAHGFSEAAKTPGVAP